MMLDQVKNLSHQMRLFGIHEACERQAQIALSQQLHPLEFLRLLLEEELLSRKDRTAKALVTKARFRFRADLEDWDYSFHKDVPKAKISELAHLSFFHNQENLLIIGKTGLGKTHLATALGVEACGRGKRVRFHKVIELVTLLIEAREVRHLGRLKTQLAKLDLLILDELGYVPASKLGAELLFDVISSAYERSSLIVTTNLPFENWTEVLGSERLTGATLDRLTHRCHIIECNGESYRLQDAKRRRRKPPKRPSG